MRNLTTSFLLAVTMLIHAQSDFRLKPDTGQVSYGASLTVQSLVSPGPGSYVAVGNVSLFLGGSWENDMSYLTAFSCSSVGSASKRLASGLWNVVRMVPGGGYITGGSRSVNGNEMAYLGRHNAGLDTLSTMSLFHPINSTGHIFDIVVSNDGSFCAGIISFGKVSILRFNSAGVPIWQKEIPNGAFGTPVSQAVQLLSYGTNVYVVNTELNQFGNDDIAVHRLDITSGDETFHRTYGSSTLHDRIRDAEWMGGEIVLLTNIGNSRTGLMRLNSNMNVALSAVFDGGQYLIGAELLTNNDGYSFIGGHIAEAGVEYSIVWQVWYNGLVGWKRKLNQYSSVTADMLFEGANIVVPTSGGMEAGLLMNFVNASNGNIPSATCEYYGSPVVNGTFYPDMVTEYPAIMAPSSIVFAETRGSIMSAYSGAITTCESMPLPVEQLYFRASPEGHTVLLQWATATEHMNDHYTVERSAVGDAFEDVVVVDGAGDSQQTTEYRAYDENPLPGTSYYRLRQTDIDGATSYSDIVPVEFKPSELLVPYPNPATAGGEIRVNGFVTAYDGLEREVARGKDVIVLPVGMYFLINALGQKATVIVQ